MPKAKLKSMYTRTEAQDGPWWAPHPPNPPPTRATRSEDQEEDEVVEGGIPSSSLPRSARRWASDPT